MSLIIFAACGLILVLIIFTAVVVKSVIKSEKNKPELVSNPTEWNHIKDFKNILEEDKKEYSDESEIKTLGADLASYTNPKNKEDTIEDLNDSFRGFENNYKTVSFDNYDSDNSDDDTVYTDTIPAFEEKNETKASAISVTLKYKDGDLNKIIKMVTSQITVGREAGSDLLLNSSSFASRNHAVFSLRDDNLYLKDLNSKNGTKVDGEKIQGEVLIEKNCEVIFGKASVSVVISKNEV